MFNRILINHSEISTKKGNRRFFEDQLGSNVLKRIKSEGFNWPVDVKRHYQVVRVPEDASEDQILKAIGNITEVHGVRWASPAVWLPSEKFRNEDNTPKYNMIKEIAVQIAEQCFKEGRTFAVKLKRSDKKYTLPSEQLERWLGKEIVENTPWNNVNLKSPDLELIIRVYRDELFISPKKYMGSSGLPVGSAGHALSLLSGGFDSPIASWMMARRGCSLDFIHFTPSHPHPEEIENSKIDRLAAWLSRYTLTSRLYMVPYTHFDLSMPSHNRPKALMVFRRFMSRTAEELANRIDAKALVTGESLAQVASQTLENLVTNNSVLSMPVFQPLIGHNKDEIIELSRKIGSHDLSVEPYKDCCSLISTNPETKSNPKTIRKFEERWIPDYQDLIDRTLDDAYCYEYECGKKVNAYAIRSVEQNEFPE